MFTELKPEKTRWTPAALVSMAAHGLFLMALIYRPLGAGFVMPSDVRHGHGDIVTELVYSPPLELSERSIAAPAHKLFLKKTQNPRSATPVPNLVQNPLLAGQEQGTLPDGPTVGFVRVPALPVVAPDVLRSLLPPGIQGDIVVEVTIDTQGNVAQTRVLQSLGPKVDEIVIAALLARHYSPATTDGVPNVSKQDVHMHFPS